MTNNPFEAETDSKNTEQALSQKDQLLINRIKAKISDGKTVTLMQEKFGYKSELYPPVSPADIIAAEATLGYRLPPLIREIYLQVGNGGFGPGYGIGGLNTDGMEIYSSYLVEMQEMSSEYRAYLSKTLEDLAQYKNNSKEDRESYEETKGEHQFWTSSDKLAFYCYWGCNVTTVVDLAKPELPIYAIDSTYIAIHPSKTLRQWWHDWLDGTCRQS